MELVVRTIELAGDSMGFDNGQPLVATVVAEDIHVEVKRQVFIGVLWCLDTALASITDFCSTKCYSLDWCNDNGGLHVQNVPHKMNLQYKTGLPPTCAMATRPSDVFLLRLYLMMQRPGFRTQQCSSAYVSTLSREART